MDAQQIRKAYLEFFEAKGHQVIPRALLVPQNDPTTLFTGSGMQPLIPYLLGESHPKGSRLVNSQTCLRAQDIEEVGDNRHTTFFEMMGNWSLGDYFKAEQLPWFWEFLTDIVGLDPNKLYVTCFIGDKDNNIPPDEKSAHVWKNVFNSRQIPAATADMENEIIGARRGINPGERIFFYDSSKNWWCRNGNINEMPIGEPGGPDSEIFYRFSDSPHTDTEKNKFGPNCHPNCDCGRFLEIGNSVFMEYVKTENGFDSLPKQNVDFGGGLERIAAAQLNSPDVFKISLLAPIISKLEELSGKTYDSHTESMRVIADHLRAATFLAVDGVVPSNKTQGYVMRRLVRRAIRFAFDLGIEQNFLEQLVPVIADLYHEDFPEVAEKRQTVVDVLAREEKIFRQTLRKGLREFDKLFGLSPDSATTPFASSTQGSADSGEADSAHAAAPLASSASPAESSLQHKQSSGEIVFMLYDTYGFPVELTVEEAFKRGIDLGDWKSGFDAKMEEQRERSHTASKGTFKGGLGGQTEQHKKYHTATHLMYQALRDVLGDHVIQRGSNITEERLRFDFSHPEKVTPEQIQQVEDIVNEQISKDLKVSFEEYPTQVAIEEKGALGQFGDRYGDTVKVYKMIADEADKPFSFEICGGPHVNHTMELTEGGKKFKIIKEEASSAGVRRIKAVLV